MYSTIILKTQRPTANPEQRSSYVPRIRGKKLLCLSAVTEKPFRGKSWTPCLKNSIAWMNPALQAQEERGWGLAAKEILSPCTADDYSQQRKRMDTLYRYTAHCKKA